MLVDMHTPLPIYSTLSAIPSSTNLSFNVFAESPKYTVTSHLLHFPRFSVSMTISFPFSFNLHSTYSFASIPLLYSSLSFLTMYVSDVFIPARRTRSYSPTQNPSSMTTSIVSPSSTLSIQFCSIPVAWFRFPIPYLLILKKNRKNLCLIEAVSQLLSALKILLLFGFKALFTLLSLPILGCWTASYSIKIIIFLRKSSVSKIANSHCGNLKPNVHQ